MRICKLAAGSSRIMTIERDAFEAATRRMRPWHKKVESGEEDENRKNVDVRRTGRQREEKGTLQFAVCPSCENPIQIIGLYDEMPHTDRPYGRHTGKAVEGFPNYDAEAYEWCPLVRGNRNYGKNSRKRKLEGLPFEILKLVRREFDRIAYVIEKETGVKISAGSARRMLDSFLSERGHLYVGATYRNVPWMVAYMSDSQSLYMQRIADNPELVAAVRDRVPDANMNEYGRLVKGRRYYGVHMCFIHHKQMVEDGDLRETMKFVVSDDARNSVYEKLLEFDFGFFERLVNLPPSRSWRNRELLDVADEVFSDYAATLGFEMAKNGLEQLGPVP